MVGEESSARVDSDAPTESDDLGRTPYVRTLARIVRTAETPLVVAIYGSWGAGKTSMMMQLRRELDPAHDGTASGDQQARTVWFDPWMHQFDETPALALLHAAANQLDLGAVARRNAFTALSKLAVALGEDIQLPFIGIRVGKLLKIRQELAQDDFNRREERARLRQHFHEVLAATGAADKRVVFFIDDLDRCQPSVALSLLEALKLYLDMPGCVYVLGVDREPLEAAVGAQYKSLGLRTESYLDKIIQLPFAIPAISDTAMDSFVAKRLPDGLSTCAEILAAASADEPRNVKRLANALLINHELAQEASFATPYDPRILAMLVLVQNQAPELYRQLRLDPDLVGELFASQDQVDDEPANGAPPSLWDLYVKDNPRLAKALRLVQLPAGLDLTPYITLTTIAPVVEPTSSARPPAGRVFLSYRRDDARAVQPLHQSLIELGWSVFQVDLEAGLDWRSSFREGLQSSDALVIAIGPHWLAGREGRRPIDDPSDVVRSEIEQGRELGVPMVPALVGGAVMPPADLLPDSLRFLPELNAVIVEADNPNRSVAALDRFLRGVTATR